ncbi:hypothetical protein JGU00_23135 [Enterobacter hormaechei]|uniref:hypothetical protein n=1 Tax=Enterobacter hormaechei TaxID=158836 RepID=UPI0018ECBA33|nr:hypothetical protein [Enterobacter hormaechei]HAS1812477.1 hypothetical protein [Enterobacter hormaechei subsp. xiangfangensis]MBJ6603544.1 hypothetical protein [Enterobacter hormaechei]MEC5516884.1 hypothetical protein [Enterobacter hormaechei]HBM2827350.1 hypothetical protein [Enterobacter hormaechei subsp. xiangfangensis]HCR0045729.1 hypothetical protein [Enterobacter hormaechei]
MLQDYNWKGIIITTGNFAASFAFSKFLTNSLTNNNDALNLVANVFSILSGFLLLVITMSGENASISTTLNALDKANQSTRFSMRFAKYYTLFLLYIATLALIFVFYLLSKDKTHTGVYFTYTKSIIGYLISFLTCFSFIQSTFIPLKIKELFEEKRNINL